jgi:ABC-type transport system involved in cytochrome bd biosynthesis fused ATPase/permease subunit
LNFVRATVRFGTGAQTQWGQYTSDLDAAGKITRLIGFVGTGVPGMTTPAIELKGISKAFGAVQANKDISIRVMPGTIHGIIGENGAGKSTLMSILYGFYKADSGEIWIAGKKTEVRDSQAAIALASGWCSSISNLSRILRFWRTSFWGPRTLPCCARRWPAPARN